MMKSKEIGLNKTSAWRSIDRKATDKLAAEYM
jgi:hypothetical protein